MTDDECLARCEVLARMAADRRESPVGSLIVLAGAIIGEGIEAARESGDITAHAEVEAIRAAVKRHGPDLSAATLYTTHEPCLLCSYVDPPSPDSARRLPAARAARRRRVLRLSDSDRHGHTRLGRAATGGTT